MMVCLRGTGLRGPLQYPGLRLLQEAPVMKEITLTQKTSAPSHSAGTRSGCRTQGLCTTTRGVKLSTQAQSELVNRQQWSPFPVITRKPENLEPDLSQWLRTQALCTTLDSLSTKR